MQRGLILFIIIIVTINQRKNDSSSHTMVALNYFHGRPTVFKFEQASQILHSHTFIETIYKLKLQSSMKRKFETFGRQNLSVDRRAKFGLGLVCNDVLVKLFCMFLSRHRL